jgi:hypothetical protein
MIFQTKEPPSTQWCTKGRAGKVCIRPDLRWWLDSERYAAPWLERKVRGAGCTCCIFYYNSTSTCCASPHLSTYPTRKTLQNPSLSARGHTINDK